MRNMRRSALLLFLFTATACTDNSPAAPTPLDRSVVLAPGQSVELTSDLSLGFVAVLDDSRCPINASCVQAGDAVVRLAVTSRTARGDHDLHTAIVAPVTFDGLELRLLELQPYPFGGRPTNADDYRATIHVRR
jgi:hypothetical protein